MYGPPVNRSVNVNSTTSIPRTIAKKRSLSPVAAGTACNPRFVNAVKAITANTGIKGKGTCRTLTTNSTVTVWPNTAVQRSRRSQGNFDGAIDGTAAFHRFM